MVSKSLLKLNFSLSFCRKEIYLKTSSRYPKKTPFLLQKNSYIENQYILYTKTSIDPEAFLEPSRTSMVSFLQN